MKVRRVDGRVLSARFEGSAGTYRVEWDLERRRGQCTCPSSDNPCKHVEALRRTWLEKPESFRSSSAVQAVAFPAERLVFEEAGSHVWRCPCGQQGGKSWPTAAEATRAAEEHLAGHSARAGLTDEDILALAEDVEAAQEDRRVRDAAERAKVLFQNGGFGSMADAVYAVAEEWDLEGRDDEGEIGEVFALLEEECDEGSLWDWTRRPGEERRVRYAVHRARQAYLAGERESMGHAALAAAGEMGLEGDDENGDMGAVFAMLQMDDDAPLWDWEQPSEAESEAFQQAIQRALQRFHAGLYETAWEAAEETAKDYGFPSESRESALIQESVFEHSPLRDPAKWLQPFGPPLRIPEDMMPQALQALGIPTASAEGQEETCPGCGDALADDIFSEHGAFFVVLDGKKIHRDWRCVNMTLGPEHDLVRQLEAAMAHPDAPAPRRTPYWDWTHLPAPYVPPSAPELPELPPQREFAVRHVAERIRRRYEAAFYPDMNVAAQQARTEFDLEGEEAAFLAILLRDWHRRHQTWSHGGTIRRTVNPHVKPLGFSKQIPRRTSDTARCDGCGARFGSGHSTFGFDRRQPEPASVEKDGKRVHLDFHCIVRAYGPDDSAVLRLEAVFLQRKERRDDLVQAAADRALRRFENGFYTDMDRAFWDACSDFRLIPQHGEVAALRSILEQAAPTGDLKAWRPARGATPDFPARLRRLGVPTALVRERDFHDCAGCGSVLGNRGRRFGFDGDAPEPSAVEVEGKKIHENFRCIVHALGADHELVRRLEEALP